MSAPQIVTTSEIVSLLMNEYGEDEMTWRALGSARRIAQSINRLIADARADEREQITGVTP